MILTIPDILSREEITVIRDILTSDDIWQDGKTTASGQAKQVKNNLQAHADHPKVRGITDKIRATCLKHEVFRAAAQPSKIIRLMISQYEPGMAYGAHVDAAFIDAHRADLSMTLFLSNPEDYDGGELVLESGSAEDRIRCKAGTLVLYPSTYVHQVSSITRGTRLAVVGWVNSRVPSAHHREMLFELETALADLRNLQTPSPLVTRLLNLRHNLLREWGR